MYRVWNSISHYAVMLLAGAALALIWANLDPSGHAHFLNFPLAFNDLAGTDATGWLLANGARYGIDEIGDVTRILTPHYLVNDMLMAFFFAIAAKEVWEALILEQGSLRGRKAATPLIATAGGMIGPVVVYLGLAVALGSETYDALARGWAVPAATDIALAYIVGRAVFGAGHPAVRFLLLLAIADDAVALLILALFYPSGDVMPAWLLLSLGSAVVVFLLFNWLPRRMDRGDQLRTRSTWVRRRLSFWPYLVAGAFGWYGFQQAGLNPVLGLLPIVPAIPHADRAFGIFSEAEQYLTDLLNQFEHMLKWPVMVVLFLFGLLNAGVALSAIGAPTMLVLAALLVGKPLGILLFGWLAAHTLNLGLPQGMQTRDLAVLGVTAGVGFTVPLVIVTAAFEPGAAQDAARIGVLLSLAAAALAILAGRLFGIQKQTG